MIELPYLNFDLVWITTMPDGTKSTAFLPDGINGVINAMPFAVYLYIGFEALQVFSEETVNHTTSTPKGMKYAMVTIGIAAFSTVLITSANRLSTTELSEAIRPHSTLLKKIIGIDANQSFLASQLLNLVHLPVTIVSCQSLLFASSRYIYALSRGGFLPAKLSITTAKEHSPVIAFFTASALTFCITVCINYAAPVNSSATSAREFIESIFVKALLLFAFVAYIFDMIVYVYLTHIRNCLFLCELWQHPASVLGCIYSICISVLWLLAAPSLTVQKFEYPKALGVLFGVIGTLVCGYFVNIQIRIKMFPERIGSHGKNPTVSTDPVGHSGDMDVESDSTLSCTRGVLNIIDPTNSDQMNCLILMLSAATPSSSYGDTSNILFAIRRSPLAIRRSPFTVRNKDRMDSTSNAAVEVDEADRLGPVHGNGNSNAQGSEASETEFIPKSALDHGGIIATNGTISQDPPGSLFGLPGMFRSPVVYPNPTWEKCSSFPNIQA
eukprot:jgi/Hompol1/2490/HPOL_006016-RA